MFDLNERTMSYGLAAFFVLAGIGGVLNAVRGLGTVGSGPAILNAIGALALFALAAAFVWLARN